MNLQIHHLAGRHGHSPVTWVAESLMGSGSNNSLVPKPNAQASWVTSRSPLLSTCWAEGMGRGKGWPLPRPGQLPPPILAEQFPLGLRSRQLRPVPVSSGLAAAVLGHPLGARSIDARVQRSLTATVLWDAGSFHLSQVHYHPWMGQQMPLSSSHPCLLSFGHSTSLSLWGAAHPQGLWFKGRNVTQSGQSEH